MPYRSIKRCALSWFLAGIIIGLMTQPTYATEAEGVVERIMISICVHDYGRPTHRLIHPCSGSSELLRPLYHPLLRILEENVGQYVKVEGAVVVGECRIVQVENLWPLPPPDCCEGDVEPDGVVDEFDLAVFCGALGQIDCPHNQTCLGDLDNDGVVDGSDLGILAADFGRTDCP